jgi:hypothetical protein
MAEQIVENKLIKSKMDYVTGTWFYPVDILQDRILSCRSLFIIQIFQVNASSVIQIFKYLIDAFQSCSFARIVINEIIVFIKKVKSDLRINTLFNPS